MKSQVSYFWRQNGNSVSWCPYPVTPVHFAIPSCTAAVNIALPPMSFRESSSAGNVISVTLDRSLLQSVVCIQWALTAVSECKRENLPENSKKQTSMTVRRNAHFSAISLWLFSWPIPYRTIVFESYQKKLRPTCIFTARCYASAVLAMGLCLCPSVWSVTSRSSTKTAKHRITQTAPHDTPKTLVFLCQRCARNSTWVTSYEGAECRWGGSKSATCD